MELQNYEEAMAVAPKVSLRYWKKCVDIYRRKLADKISSPDDQSIGLDVES